MCFGNTKNKSSKPIEKVKKGLEELGIDTLPQKVVCFDEMMEYE